MLWLGLFEVGEWLVMWVDVPVVSVSLVSSVKSIGRNGSSLLHMVRWSYFLECRMSLLLEGFKGSWRVAESQSPFF